MLEYRMLDIELHDYVFSGFILAIVAVLILMATRMQIKYHRITKLELALKRLSEIHDQDIKKQDLLIRYLQSTVKWYSKTSNIQSKCPTGGKCENAANMSLIAKETLQQIEDINQCL